MERIDIPAIETEAQKEVDCKENRIYLESFFFRYILDFRCQGRDPEDDYMPLEPRKFYSYDCRPKSLFSGVQIHFEDKPSVKIARWILYVSFNGSDDIKILFDNKTDAMSIANKIESWVLY